MFFFQLGRGGVGPSWGPQGGGVVARYVTIDISPDFAGTQQSPRNIKHSSVQHLSEVARRGGMGGGGGSRFAMYTEVHRKTGRARTDFLASKFPRAQEAPRCRDSFAGRRSPAGKIVPDSHSHGHPRVGCTLIVPSSIKWALLQSSYASPGSFSEIRDCENVHTCGCFTVTNFRE